MEQSITQQPTATNTKSTGKKFILVSFGLLAAGAISYFGYEYWKKKRLAKETAADDTDSANASANDIPYAPPTTNSSNANVTQNNEFPLKKGSRGAKVKQLQQALIAKLGTGSLGKSGADGDFGSKTEAALVKAGFATTIDEDTFNVVVQGSAANFDADASAKELNNAITSKSFSDVISALQKLNSSSDYSSVSEKFKETYRINGVHQTLVNAALGAFSDASQKQAIRLQFIRMGLHYDGKKWSLSGIDTPSLITTQATLVWINPKHSIKVPARMVLGKELAQRGAYTLFENKQQHFLVKTNHVNYL